MVRNPSIPKDVQVPSYHFFFMRLRSNTSFESHLKSVAPYEQLIYT